ncbi:MAG: 4-(cytidine 5'-diphospho)-2-C-methyl-D-erythritol kinase [Alphaproteobacteria bacterium]|nr:4-(cytidine 5'-diphospho)-2-C-methyl-D-erythritol kinase [Rickettsiales bacterium]
MFILKAPAKLNICLKLTGRKENGYYELFSLASFIELSDTVKIKENKSVFPSVFMSGKYGHMFDNFHISSIEGNTVMKALDFMHQQYRTPMNFDISINKDIPVAGGLGGSSADSSLIINFISQYFDIDISREMVDELLEKIGSDTQFFMQDNTALCEGIGDRVTPISLDPASEAIPTLIVYPNFELSTNDVYAALPKDIEFFSKEQEQEWRNFILTPNIEFKHLVKKTIKLGNDLLESATSIRKEIKMLVNMLDGCKGAFGSGMSGSGSCCFAMFDKEEDLHTASIELSSRLPAYEFIPTRLLPRCEKQQVMMSSRPAMEMIFHPHKEEDWEKIK